MFTFERERETKYKKRGRERERERKRENLKQAPGTELSAQSLMQDLNSQAVRS